MGLDSAVVKLQKKDLYLVQTTDFFYPLIEDPFVMGRIACANVLSDLYAMGVSECDNMLMILGISEGLSDDERDIVIPMILRGFKVIVHGDYRSIFVCSGGNPALNTRISLLSQKFNV